MTRALQIFRLLVLSALVVAAPALAGDGSTPLPEPSTITLISLGVLGVLVGRRLSSKRPRK